MNHRSNMDREFLQNVLASAFTMQQRLTDDKWRFPLVEVERRTRGVSNTIGLAVDLLHDQIPLPRLEENDQIYGTSAPTEEGAPNGVHVSSASTETSEAHCVDDTEVVTGASTPAPANVLPTAVDILDACFPSFGVSQPEVKTAWLRFGDWWKPLQLILLVALVLLLGWMLSRVSSRRIAAPKGSPQVSVNQGAVTTEPEKNRQPEQKSQPPGSRRSRGPDTPRDSLVVYERGRVVFRLKQGEDAADFRSNDEAVSSVTVPAQVFKDATIGVFCDGDPDIRHDGVTLTALMTGGPADQAGIKAGDVILAINDHDLFTIRELQEEISHHQPETKIGVRYRRHATMYYTSLVVARVQ